MGQTFHILEKVATKALMPQHHFFVLTGKRTKIKSLSFQNVTIIVLFKRNSCNSIMIDKNAQRLSEVHLSPALCQLANADNVIKKIRKKTSHSHFYFALCFFAKVEEQRTVKKHMRGGTRVDG